VQRGFVPATKAHPAFYVRNIRARRDHLLHNKVDIIDDDARRDEGIVFT